MLVEIYYTVYVFQPAEGIPPWTPTALAWIPPPPICNTEHRGGSVIARAGLLWATRQANATFVEIMPPSLITKCPWQCGFTPTSPPPVLSVLFLSFFVRPSIFSTPLPQWKTIEWSPIILQAQQTLLMNCFWVTAVGHWALTHPKGWGICAADWIPSCKLLHSS